MKRMHLLMLCVVFVLHVPLHAQKPLIDLYRSNEAKPLLFGNLPDEFEISLPALQSLFSKELNAQINTQLSDQLLIAGKLINQSQPVPGTFSINIRLENFDNALFNATARLQANNSFYMRGRIVHPKYGDVLVLVKNKDKYVFQKNSQRTIMPD